MASYNGERYIRRQINSILTQLGEHDELIISDDGSTDQTIDIIKSYKDNRIKIFYGNYQDYTKNFENALRHALGEYIFLSDQDDEWFPSKIETVMNFFSTSGVDLIVTDAVVVDADMKVLNESYIKSKKVSTGFFRNWIKTRYIGACMVFNKKLLDKVLPIPGSSKYIAHDYWITCVSELCYKTAILYKPLMYYVRHGKNTSPGIFGQSNLSLSERIYKRFYVAIFLIDRYLFRNNINRINRI